jgi:hypothetical protein
MEIASHIKKAVSNFNPRLVIYMNPDEKWIESGCDPCWRFVIAIKTKSISKPGYVPGFGWIRAIIDDTYPVLGIPDASHIDVRWFEQLYEYELRRMYNNDVLAEYSKRNPVKERLIERKQKKQEEGISTIRDWARYEGSWYFNKHERDNRTFGARSKYDPTRERKELQDLLGRNPQ